MTTKVDQPKNQGANTAMSENTEPPIPSVATDSGEDRDPAQDAAATPGEKKGPEFDLSAVERIVVLPLGFGRAAPGARAASFNGNPPVTHPFSMDKALMWEAESQFKGPRGFGKQEIPSFLRYGKHVSGRHERGSVSVIEDTGFEAAVAAAESLLATDGRPGGAGVAEWCPALVTVGGLTSLALHVRCLDAATDEALRHLLLTDAGLRACVEFGRLDQERQVPSAGDVDMECWWNPLRLVGSDGSPSMGRAEDCDVPAPVHADTEIGRRIRAVLAGLTDQQGNRRINC